MSVDDGCGVNVLDLWNSQVPVYSTAVQYHGGLVAEKWGSIDKAYIYNYHQETS